LAGVKFEERGESGDVDIVIDDGVRLLDDHHARMGAREAPQDHSRCPECPTVVYFEGKAAVVAAKMLEAIRKEIGALPTLQADDVTYVPLVVRKAMECGAKVARESAVSLRPEDGGEGTREFAGDEDSGRFRRGKQISNALKSQRRDCRRFVRARPAHVTRGGVTRSAVSGDYRHEVSTYPHADFEEGGRNRLAAGQDNAEVTERAEVVDRVDVDRDSVTVGRHLKESQIRPGGWLGDVLAPALNRLGERV
jgi:hypothetical protein